MEEIIEKDAHPEEGVFAPSYIPKFTTARQFADAKIEMLREHMMIDLPPEDIDHLYSLKEECEIIAAVKGLINKHWR